MVSRYAHLTPGHLAAAVERLVTVTPTSTDAVELARNCAGESSEPNNCLSLAVGGQR
jgi:hypothetical protein